MLEGSDAKTEIVRGLLLPSPMTVYGAGVGEPAFPQLSAAARATAASLSVHESGRCGRDSANLERGEGTARAEPSPYLLVG